MEVEKLAAPMGAAVTGVDVRVITSETFETLDDLFCQHQVLVFPDQQLTPQDQMKFANHWGELVRHPYAGLEEFPEIIELRNYGKRRDVNQHWHTDMSYHKQPPMLTMLYAHDVPDFGGDTAFANQVLAQIHLYAKRFADLPAEEKAANITVEVLPKHLDEQVAALMVQGFGGVITRLTEDQAQYIGVSVDGPFKTDSYKY